MSGTSYHRFISKLTASFFFVGYLPLIPGTFGSLAGLAVYWFMSKNPLEYSFVTALITILGFWVSSEAEIVFGKKDDRRIVIDEVSGMLISLAFLPFDLRILVWGFLIFRLLDTLKPYPAGILQKLKGGSGVMMDDIVAGLYTNIVLQLVLRLAAFKTS
jgi:phosphatidylglycerophosphatase A